MDKAQELLKIKQAMETDTDLPLVEKPEDVIPGDGNPDAKIVFIGEAGGYHESVQRKPFVGQAGKLLDRGLKAIGMPREDVYITNMVKTRPPSNRDPFPEELAAYSAYLDRELEVIQPKMVVTLGRFSMGKFLPGEKISGIHGKKFMVKWHGKDLVVVPMYHPAAALRNGNVMQEFRKDFLNLPNIMKEILKPEVKQMNLI
jgi:uracil-DNA glycosylase